MAFGKSVVVLAMAASLCVIYFAQEAFAQDAGAIALGECRTRNDCLRNPGYVASCSNKGPICCHGFVEGEAGPNPNTNVVAIIEGKCVCCGKGEACKLIKANATNTETAASATEEKCSSRSA